ncbi:MAG: histidine--tRNA ligase [Planctomycetota bacterium]|nr:MAG: histidine--tRNA ligase [Planctomycetota bacterium]REJ95066.1 MAG: histidine--tRNA ligase [Planctomycetota bacterium]REK31604.1 MAG: histidine--tRNA ligase [Planctomycetota bacterium]REK42288.1 MAG: histidine--tRNA ligase [Planctomycetota bacterium]
MIQPRTLKGFRDFQPREAGAREELIDRARAVFHSYGFAPIDTPALEYLEILQGKGSEETDKQMYQFEDAGGRRVGMRFDLTVPLARFAAQHIGQLGTPLKRYHVATVWRGENTQRGRFREFMQCDFDTIGTDNLSSDIETALVIHDLFLALGFEDFRIHLNNRKVLTGLLETLGLAEHATAILRALDKLAKIGAEKVQAEIVAATGTEPQAAEQVLALCQLTGTNAEILDAVTELVADSETGRRGAEELRRLLAALDAVGVPEARVKLDVAIARGLDYYTGTIFETFLGALPDIGSVCSGGRYDNLAELYTKQQLPGIGASLGLDRLLAAMEELDMLTSTETPAVAFIPLFDEARLHDYLRLAAQLREAAICVEVYPLPKKLGQQLKYADRRGHRVALILGDNEFAASECQVKDLATGEATAVPLEENAASLIAAIRGLVE